MTHSSIATTVRPYLAVHEGALVVEPLPGLMFDPGITRMELYNLLAQHMATDRCVATVNQEEGATHFTVAGPRGTVRLVFDDDSDRLVTIIPLHALETHVFH